MERIPGGPFDPHRLAHGGPGDTEDASRRSQRLQILATEHWALLATRSLSWSESFSRAGMFLTVLSGAVVALALVAQATRFTGAFVLFATLLLPVVLVMGGATFVRLVEINNEDARWVAGMNRLRHAYIELEPELEPYFTSGWTDDAIGIERTYGIVEHGSGFFHGFITTPATIGFVNAIVAAVLGAIAVVQLWGLSMESVVPVVSGAAVFLAAVALQAAFNIRSAAQYSRRNQALFPPLEPASGPGAPPTHD
jgi:hypothetical protein